MVEITRQYTLQNKGEFFGDYSFITNEASKFIFRVLEPSSLLRFNKFLFFKILRNFPKDFERYCQLRDLIKDNAQH